MGESQQIDGVQMSDVAEEQTSNVAETNANQAGWGKHWHPNHVHRVLLLEISISGDVPSTRFSGRVAGRRYTHLAFPLQAS